MIQRVVFVIGVHRSGTSALTKGLSTMGVFLDPSINFVDSYNEKGYWEDPAFRSLNDQMLKQLQSFDHRRRNILPITKEETNFLCSQGFVQQAAQLLLTKISDSSSFNHGCPQPVGFKDPMATLLLPFWKRVCKESGLHLSFVIALRNPASAVASLSAFTLNQQLPRKSFWAWISFLLAGLNHSEGCPRILVDYNELLKSPTTQIQRIAHAIKLNINQDLLKAYSDNFIDPSLCHFHSDFIQKEEVSFEWAMEMYQQLLAVSQDQMSFSELQRSLQKWNQLFSPATCLLSLLERDELTIQQLTTELREIKSNLSDMTAEKLITTANFCKTIHELNLRMLSHSI